MTFKHKLGAASVLAAAWYSAAAAAADYNTQIYSVAVDGDSGVLLIDGVDLAPAGAPAGAHVQLLGQTLTIHEAASSSTHLEAALPDSVSLNPGTGYQLYVSPSRSRTSAEASPADQAFFTLYVTSKVDGARATTVIGGSRGGGAGNAPAAGGTKSSTNNFLSSLGSAFSINPHSATTSNNGVTTNNGSTFSLPYSGSLSSSSTLFSVTNTGPGDGVDGINASTAANATGVLGMLSSTSSGASSAAVRGINSGTGSSGYGVYGTQAGSGSGVFGATTSGRGVDGESTSGIGVFGYSNSGTAFLSGSPNGHAAQFVSNNASNNNDVVTIGNAGKGRNLVVSSNNPSSAVSTMQVSTAGIGSVATFSATNSPSTAVTVSNPGTGMGLSSSSTGATGIYGSTGVLSGAGVLGDNLNGGEAVTGRTASLKGTATGAVVGRNDGPGYGVSGFIASDTSGAGIGVLGRVGISGSTGEAGHFENVNSSNTANALYVATNGPGVIADHTQGNAGNFFNNNTSGVGAGVRGEVNSIFGNNGTAGVYGSASGTGGYGGYFDHTNASGFGIALQAITNGGGVVAHFETPLGAGGTSNNGNTQPTVQIVQDANGEGLDIASTSPTGTGTTPNTANILNVSATGPGVIADHSQGNAGNFFMNNTSGVGAGVRGEVNSIFGNNGTAGVYGVASGTGGYAGYFEHTETTGFGIALQVVTNDVGTAMVVDHEGSSGNPVIIESGGLNVARIDKTGKGFFNGGTQTGGADLAEFVPVSGSIPQVGDVVEIDPAHPDTFRLCSRANTTRVAGIISTAPGVTLNAKDGATQAMSGPALALAGRVPTKVNDRGGKIHIGDLLVASAEPGRAMRAPAHPRPGTVIGKALQDSDQAESTVEVLVMLR